jgi:disulfide bond formation protein DsbB
MSATITSVITTLTLFSHFVFIYLILAFIFRKGWGNDVIKFIGKKGIILSFLITLSAVVGSLIYSNVVGFEPCELCWWQRIFVYPQAVIFLIAWIKKDRKIFSYTIPLSIIGALVGAYHSFINLGGESSLPCAVEGGACAKLFVLEYGYITIPMMSLTISAFLILVALISKNYDKNNSNS